MTADQLPDEPPADADNDVDHYDGVPKAREAEQAFIGAILNAPEQHPHAATLLDPDDFYWPAHETIWQAITAVAATGAKAEPALVLEHLTRRQETQKVGGAPYLFELVQAGFHGQLDEYARIVRDTARLRSALTAANKIRHAVTTARPDTVEHSLERALDTLDHTFTRYGATSTHTPIRHVETIDDLLAGHHEDTYDWVIPGLIERQERVILTAEEGAGKTTLLRQIAIQAASGLHPFTGELITPIRVLHIDVENTRRQSRRQYRALRIQAGDMLDPTNLRIELRTAGIDLTTTEDRDWLLDTTRFINPDLLMIGPIYKLANGDPTEEKSAKPVAMALDAVREQTDCAVLVEAHAAKAPSGHKKRPHEPYGWSGWLRWPEVGLWLDRDGTLSPWRGAREERSWPEKLERGGDWPWSPAISEKAELWNRIRIAREHHNEPMSQREVSQATGIPKTTVDRLIGKSGPYNYGWNGINNHTRRT